MYSSLPFEGFLYIYMYVRFKYQKTYDCFIQICQIDTCWQLCVDLIWDPSLDLRNGPGCQSQALADCLPKFTQIYKYPLYFP